ncbi:MAG: hypothetical protein CMH47_18560 [Muricauda sp.]|nr:hypothetical protein [Allomuricauda sp.]
MFEPPIFNSPITVNFGGKFIYEITESPTTISIRRKPNDKYLDAFFDPTRILLNISAIVGANGTGKTSLMYEIVESLINNRNNNIVIFEDGEKVVLHNFMRINKKISISPKFELQNLDVDINTIYYSPFLDFKPRLKGIDLSFDTTLQNDLQNIFDLAPQSGFVYPIEVLRRANYKRIRNLKVSDLAEPIKEAFDFPDDDLHRITFTRYRIDADSKEVNFHNTPIDFQPFLEKLFQKIRSEGDETRHSKRTTERDRFILQKNLLKNYILMDVFCILVKLMEIENTYLREGHLDDKKIKEFEKNPKDYSGYQLFKLWLNNYYYSKGNRKNLPDEETLKLFDYLFTFIDGIEYDEHLRGSTHFNWDTKSIFVSIEQLDELYELEQNFINALSLYYLGKDENDGTYYETVSQIPNYLNFEPSNRNLSSGETAMLNLFSRIHEYFDNKIIQLSVDKKYSYYLLLLDEADLGFHPIWKRGFVNTLIRVVQGFFKKIGAKVQIIMSTHDPLSLSDLPTNNVIYINSIEGAENKEILEHGDPKRPKYSFGANLTDLLAESFFLEDSLMGDFAKEKIQRTIDWLNNKDRNLEEKEYHNKLISMVDEPILRSKLEDMYYEAFANELNRENQRQHLRDMAKRYGLDINFDEQ